MVTLHASYIVCLLRELPGLEILLLSTARFWVVLFSVAAFKLDCVIIIICAHLLERLDNDVYDKSTVTSSINSFLGNKPSG